MAPLVLLRAEKLARFRSFSFWLIVCFLGRAVVAAADARACCLCVRPCVFFLRRAVVIPFVVTVADVTTHRSRLGSLPTEQLTSSCIAARLSTTARPQLTSVQTAAVQSP
uniref:Putative secreted protein n=1 Tax=Anopheles darlingi TaxID=43151 RepID=A0A2M4DHC4_ANODA